MEDVSTIKQTKIIDKNFVAKYIDSDGKVCYRANLFDQVGPIENYVPLIHALNSAKEGERVTININSPGGYVTTGLRIMQAMFNCKANVETYGVGPCASIAACIWAAGKTRILSEPLGSLMVHMPSSQVGGKTLDIAEECKFTNEFFAGLIRQLFGGVLTTEELDKVINERTDSYFPADVINQRIAANNDKALEGGIK